MNVPEFKNIVWDCSRKINENTSRIFSPVCEQYGLTMLQVGILSELSSDGSQTIGSLAEGIYVAGTNISAMCKKLDNMGLLKRTRNQSDERVVNVTLTEKGSIIVSEIEKIFDERITQIMDDGLAEDLDDIIKGMKKLDNLLEKIASVDK